MNKEFRKRRLKEDVRVCNFFNFKVLSGDEVIFYVFLFSLCLFFIRERSE